MNNTIGLWHGEGQERAVLLSDDRWEVLPPEAAVDSEPWPILPWARWQALVENGELSPRHAGVMLDPDEDPEVLTPWVGQLPLIALQFPGFMDGRAYSQASLLRTRLGYEGDLRALGDVLRDQLVLMRHCGFSSFCVRADKPATEAIKGLSGFDQIYARSVASPEPLFRRRERR